MKGLTLNEEPNVGHPHASRDCYDELVPIPNGDAGDCLGKVVILPQKRRTGRTCGAQSKATRQQRPRTQRSKSTNKRSFLRLNVSGGILTNWKTVWAWIS